MATSTADQLEALSFHGPCLCPPTECLAGVSDSGDECPPCSVLDEDDPCPNGGERRACRCCDTTNDVQMHDHGRCEHPCCPEWEG